MPFIKDQNKNKFSLDSQNLLKTKIEIGDITQEDFQPQAKLMYWDNECNFSIRLIDDDISEAIIDETIDDKIQWKKNTKTARFYKKNDTTNGFEFEIELKEKPNSNIISFSIQTKGLDFFYQPKLTKAEIEEGCQRPDNIVGSYAVYHKTKIGNYTNGKNYFSGKAFHIYRPWAEDSDGKRVWCDLNIDIKNELLTITIPKDFLNTATYPIIVDPTFGDTTQGGSTGSTGRPIGCKFTATETGSVVSMTSFISATSGVVSMAIYSETGSNSPVTLLAQDSGDTSFSTAGFYTCNISLLIAPQDYWLIIWMNGSSSTYYYDETGVANTNKIGSAATYEVWDNPWITNSSGTRRLTIYATYNVVGSSSQNRRILFIE